MIRSLAIAFVLLAALIVTACGSPGAEELKESQERQAEEVGAHEGSDVEAADEGEEEAPAEEATEEEATSGEGTTGEEAAAAITEEARTMFSETCGSCHVLADAGTSGTVGPALDGLGLTADDVAAQIANGGGAMPPGLLSGEDAEAVAAYVAAAAAK
jgi:cytochrome c551